jgi:hypothetical protein
VLFSSSEVAPFLNETFEPVWESVRPAPLVTIDFGNSLVIRRTLQGNVATYVCGPDGVVYDVLPGIYTPDVYRRELESCRKLADTIRVWNLSESVLIRTNILRVYHAAQAIRLAQRQATRSRQIASRMLGVAQTGGGFKGGFGGGFQAIGGGNVPTGNGIGGFQGIAAGIGGGGGGIGGFQGIEGPTERVIMGLPAIPVVVPAVPLASRPELALDAQVNELIRRRLIHERLSWSGSVHPDELKKWLFRDVLRADLDDPLLGLGGVLNANYPFGDEDRAIEKRKR